MCWLDVRFALGLCWPFAVLCWEDVLPVESVGRSGAVLCYHQVLAIVKPCAGWTCCAVLCWVDVLLLDMSTKCIAIISTPAFEGTV